MIVRPATESDVPAIAAIYNHAVLHTCASADEEPQPEPLRLAWLARHERQGLPVLVAEVQGQVVGWSSLSLYHQRAAYRYTLEDSVYVAPEAQGRGVGTALLRPLLARATSLEMHRVVALIEAGNRASVRLHEALGFVHAGRLTEAMFKFGRWLDVAFLEYRIARPAVQ